MGVELRGRIDFSHSSSPHLATKEEKEEGYYYQEQPLPSLSVELSETITCILQESIQTLMLNSAQPFDCQFLKNGKQISSWHICSTLDVIQDSKCTIYVIVLVFVMDFVLV